MYNSSETESGYIYNHSLSFTILFDWMKLISQTLNLLNKVHVDAVANYADIFISNI